MKAIARHLDHRCSISIGGRDVAVAGDQQVFKTQVVIGVTLHNQAASLLDCLASISSQDSVPLPFSVLLLDDSSADDWPSALAALDPNIALCVAEAACGSAACARNTLLEIADCVFPSARWVARLDADDRFAAKGSFGSMVATALATGAGFVLGGNRLRYRGELLERTNPATPELLKRDYVLSRLGQMARGEDAGELPSCNLMLRTQVPWRYPEQTSAEDHWLVAKLLLQHPGEGAVLAHPFYADYTLEGSVTQENHHRARYLAARQALWSAAQGWAEKEAART